MVRLHRPEVTLPCLAVVARHVGQGLRDYNLSLAHDRQASQLQLQEGKLSNQVLCLGLRTTHVFDRKIVEPLL